MSEIGKFITEGLKAVAPTATLFIFAILYFGVMRERGLFAPLVTFLLKCTKGRPLAVAIVTVAVSPPLSPGMASRARLKPQNAGRGIGPPDFGGWRTVALGDGANNAEALLSGALAGLGIAHLPTWLISEYLLRGELLPLFCEGGLPQPEASGIYALRLTREADSRTRLLLEFLKSRFGPVPPWDQALNSGLKRE